MSCALRRGTGRWLHEYGGLLGEGGAARVIIGTIAERRGLGASIALASAVHMISGIVLLTAALAFVGLGRNAMMTLVQST